MNKVLFIAATLLIFALSGCATKTAPKATDTLPTTSSATTTDDSISQPKASTSAIEGAEITDRGGKSLAEMGIAIEPVYFNYDSFLLSDASKASLVNTSQVFLQNPALKAIVAGHCDDRGSEMYNIALGEKRALSVKNYLTTLGVEADRLEVVSYGEEKPAVSGFDEEARALNRRVEFM
ncbi:MAG: OmpA family protein [Desulfuromonadales bacterium]|nr:OmpA family protein [Desulfuromonadales bacterium]